MSGSYILRCTILNSPLLIVKVVIPPADDTDSTDNFI